MSALRSQLSPRMLRFNLLQTQYSRRLATSNQSPRQYSTASNTQAEPLTRFQYFIKNHWAPEAAPMVAIVTGVLGLAGAFAWNGAHSSDVSWRPKKDRYPWLKVPTDQAHLEATPAYIPPSSFTEDKSYHGERPLQRKSFKVPRFQEA